MLHDWFKQQIHKSLTLQMVLFSGNQGSESLGDLPKTTLGKQDSNPAFLGFRAHAHPLHNSSLSSCQCYADIVDESGIRFIKDDFINLVPLFRSRPTVYWTLLSGYKGKRVVFCGDQVASWRKGDWRWVMEVGFELAEVEWGGKPLAAVPWGSQSSATKMRQILAFSRKFVAAVRREEVKKVDRHQIMNGLERV